MRGSTIHTPMGPQEQGCGCLVAALLLVLAVVACGAFWAKVFGVF